MSLAMTPERSSAEAEILAIDQERGLRSRRLSPDASMVEVMKLEPSLRDLPPAVSVKLVAQLLDDITTPLEPPRPKVADPGRILKDFLAALLVCTFASLGCVAVVFVFSRMNWVNPRPGGGVGFDTLNYTLLTVIMFVSALSFFIGVEFIATFGYQRFWDQRFYYAVLSASAVYVVSLLVMNSVGFHFWWYYVDVIVLVAVYTTLSFALGFFGSAAEGVSRREQLSTGLWFLFVEVIVAATALVYAMCLIPIYLTLSPLYQSVWRVTLHPIYFEVLMMIPVRHLVSRQLKSLSVLKALAVVHAQAHISSIGRMMLAGFGDLAIAVVTIVLVNVGKFLFRMTSQLRDGLFNKMFSRKVFSGEKEAEEEQAFRQFVRAINLHVDIIMENSSVVAAGLCLYMFQPHATFFMLPFPNKGTNLTLTLVIASICIQLGVGAIFDYAALFFGARHLKMPVSETFEQMKARSGAFFGFLIYGIVTMGILATLYMACRVPRPMFCPLDEICSCNFLAVPCS